MLAAGCARPSRAPRVDPPEIQEAIAQDDTASAIALLEERTRREPAETAAYIRLAQLLRLRGTVLDRLSAQRVLEKGLRDHPDDVDLLVEIGKTYYEQGFYGDAQRAFSSALAHDPHRCEARVYLGANAFRKWRHVQPYTEYLSTAVEHLRYAASCAPEDRDSHFKLAFSRYVLGDTSLALETCESLRRVHPEASEPLFLAGCIAFERAQWSPCRDRFQEALALLSDDERMHYTDIALLLDSEDKAKPYREASAEERVALQRLYWIEHDPDPTTEVNPRLLENIYRVFLSEARFAQATPPLRGWETERGKALIKFGRPTHARTTLQGIRPWDGRTEIWTYLDDRGMFDLYFRDEYLNGNYTVPIDDDLSARRLFEDPVVSSIRDDAVPIDAAMDVVAFRDSDVSSTVYVSFSADDEALERHLRTWRVDSFTTRSAFFTEDGEPRGYFSRTVARDSFPAQALPGGRSRHYAARYELPFDSYRVAHCVEDERGLTRALAWSGVNTLRFTGSSLVLSDILPHTLPADSAGRFVTRGERRFFSNPRRQFAHSERLRLYVEIYHLDVSEGVAAFDVTYSIFPVRPESGTWRRLTQPLVRALAGADQAVISQSFRRTGTADTASEELDIDIDSLEPGDYEVRVSVLDNHSGKKAATSGPFAKLPRQAAP